MFCYIYKKKKIGIGLAGKKGLGTFEHSKRPFELCDIAQCLLASCYLWFYQHTCPFPSLLFAKWSLKGPSFYPLPSGQTTPPPPGGSQTVCEGEGSALPVIDQHRWINWHTECFGKCEIRAIFLPGKLLFNYCIFRGFALSRFHFGYSHQRNSVKNKYECPPANKAFNVPEHSIMQLIVSARFLISSGREGE